MSEDESEPVHREVQVNHNFEAGGKPLAQHAPVRLTDSMSVTYWPEHLGNRVHIVAIELLRA